TARLVKALFSEFLLDESLPQLGRVLLVMLQLPYTRIALAEPDFLETDSHPARMLLGQLSELALSWDVAADETQIADDPVLEQFRRIVQRFYEAEHLYLIPFTDLLFAAVLCTEEQRQKNARSTEQAITSAMSASSSDQLRQSISQLLAQKTEGMSLPKAVQRLLDDAWAHVMYVNALAYGVESEMWRQDEAVVNALLASIAAPETFNNREQLISMLPSLLTALRSGMYSIELNSTLIHQLLSDLEVLHKTIIIQISDSGQLIDFSASALSQQQAPSALPFIDARIEALAAEQTAAAEVAHDEGEIAEQQAPESLDAEDILSRIGQGVWLDWHRSDHKERCQVAAHIKHAKKYILTNSGGRKIADVEEDLMAQLLASGEMMLAEPGQVFEKALESVIGGIRSTR
ncbi:MAG: DUF1631 domain-containing protein, partial [Gammaproteobacteria bacterium]|nr:DUF1631 domain-containing protein [Gammaproteobacteria bacterium]